MRSNVGYRKLWRIKETMKPKYSVRSRAGNLLYFLSKTLINCPFGHHFGIVASLVEIRGTNIYFTCQYLKNIAKKVCTTFFVLLTCIIRVVYQYIETNVMHFLFNLLTIKGLYMFWALLAHPQEVLHKRHLVYCVRVMSVGARNMYRPLILINLIKSTSLYWYVQKVQGQITKLLT
jgi:hypothetical protein